MKEEERGEIVAEGGFSVPNYHIVAPEWRENTRKIGFEQFSNLWKHFFFRTKSSRVVIKHKLVRAIVILFDMEFAT